MTPLAAKLMARHCCTSSRKHSAWSLHVARTSYAELCFVFGLNIWGRKELSIEGKFNKIQIFRLIWKFQTKVWLSNKYPLSWGDFCQVNHPTPKAFQQVQQSFNRIRRFVWWIDTETSLKKLFPPKTRCILYNIYIIIISMLGRPVGIVKLHFVILQNTEVMCDIISPIVFINLMWL